MSEYRPNDDAGTPHFRLGYHPALDGLRGLSILFVMFVHSFKATFRGGWVGVDIFFVLSGFLITVILLQEWSARGSISFTRFYYRRALRLLPALLLVVSAVWLMTALLFPEGELSMAHQSILGAVFYYSNFRIMYFKYASDLLIHTWSLSLEEQFYLIWPIVLSSVLWLQWKRGWVIGLVCAGIAAAICTKILILNNGGNAYNFFFLPHTRADTLLFGCLAGLLVYWNMVPQSRNGLICRDILCLMSCVILGWILFGSSQPDEKTYCIEFIGAAVSVCVIIVTLMHAPPFWLTAVLRFAPLVWLGRISYGLYLLHYPVHHFIQLCLSGYIPSVSLPPLAPWQQAILEYSASLGLAILSFYLVERPCLRLKDRWGQSVQLKDRRGESVKPELVQQPVPAKPVHLRAAAVDAAC